MHRENYLFRDQVLKITTLNLTMRIVAKNNTLNALCYFTLPPTYSEYDTFKVSEDLSLNASTLEFPLFTIEFDITNVPYNNINNDFFGLYEEARLALLDAIKWREYWFNL